MPSALLKSFPHSLRVIPVICQLTLLQMSLNFVRSAVSPSLQVYLACVCVFVRKDT